MADVPNVLFVLTDQQRPDWVGMDPDVPVRTPTLRTLADRGTWFANAVCPSPVCNPSRACLASGLEYHRCPVPSNDVDFPANRPTYFRRLRDEAGYHVLGCGKFDLASGYPPGPTGARGIERVGFSDGLFTPAKNDTVLGVIENGGEPRDPYTASLAEHGLLADHVEDYRRRSNWAAEDRATEDLRWTVTEPTPLPDEAYYDTWITRSACALLADAPRDRPWFLVVNLQNPHHPWDVTEEMHGWYRDPDIEFPAPTDPPPEVPPEAHQAVRRNYAAMVEHLDRCLGRLLGTVADRGEREETVVVFASDHGEMLGDHGQWTKLSPLQPSVGVPLVVAGPGVEGRGRVEAPATILDLHATFLDWAGLDAGDVDSRSMAPYLAGRGDTPRDVVFSGLSAWRLAFDGRHKLVRGYDPERRRGDQWEPMAVPDDVGARRREERPPLLYDVTEGERRNRYADRPAVAKRLAASLSASLDGP